MSALCPSLKLLKQNVSAGMEDFFSDHTAIVVRPSVYHLIQLFNELSLWGMDVLSDEELQFLGMSFDGLLTWGNNGFEAERVSPSICAGVRLSYRELSHRPAKKIKPDLLLIGVQGMSDMGLA